MCTDRWTSTWRVMSKMLATELVLRSKMSMIASSLDRKFDMRGKAEQKAAVHCT